MKVIIHLSPTLLPQDVGFSKELVLDSATKINHGKMLSPQDTAFLWKMCEFTESELNKMEAVERPEGYKSGHYLLLPNNANYGRIIYAEGSIFIYRPCSHTIMARCYVNGMKSFCNKKLLSSIKYGSSRYEYLSQSPSDRLPIETYQEYYARTKGLDETTISIIMCRLALDGVDTDSNYFFDLLPHAIDFYSQFSKVIGLECLLRYIDYKKKVFLNSRVHPEKTYEAFMPKLSGLVTALEGFAPITIGQHYSSSYILDTLKSVPLMKQGVA